MTAPFSFHGPNMGYVLELYDRYLQDPASVDAETRAFFQNWSPELPVESSNGAPAPSGVEMRKVVGAVSYAQSIRQFGHLAARLDPLGRTPPNDPTLHPDYHGLTRADLEAMPAQLIIDGPIVERAENAAQAIDMLHEVYCGTIGYDNEHVQNPEERAWLREVAESRQYRYQPTPDRDRELLELLTRVETMEHFLQRTFPTKYRFSVEGLDMMVPMLDEMVHLAADSSVRHLMIGMAHRGRLNVLAHIMDKRYREILAEFKDTEERAQGMDAIGVQVDDVKYHKGALRQIGDLTIQMAPNPSHLEAVNPVVVGMARAAGTDRSNAGLPPFDMHRTMQILIHGDAAFPGQGIVAETFNLSRLPGYAVGGTVHVIANNQVGFTTLPNDGRSTLYASDLAKGFRVPIVHVNADDPAACIEVARIAAAYQEKFEKDFLIDLIGYRRYGHNELDQPRFTQPMMYGRVDEHETARKLWAGVVVGRGHMTEAAVESMLQDRNDYLQAEYDVMDADQPGLADPAPETPPAKAAATIETAIDPDKLTAINDGLRGTYEGINFYNTRFKKSLIGRRTALNDPNEKVIDWAGAEELAFATILADGIPIRMTGQDSQRGTFSHRHAMLHDAKTGEEFAPLQMFPQAKASFEIHNSPLSEEAVLGFEYGYNLQAQNALVLWEAQYGDFVNGAQNIIDEFILSSREKWGDTPSLVMLLPHGHEGAGPDHSSGRLERFLSLAAKTNMRIANCTTSAQYFHLLRRQALLLETDPLPLVVMAPKSLLRQTNVASSMNDLTQGKWQPVIDDEWVKPKDVKRIVFVSGKFYYDLMAYEREKYPDVAVVRVEQLYPFPAEALREVINRYANVTQIVWAQEEPKNMGAFDYMGYRLKKLVGMSIPVNYVGRNRSSTPAEGSKTVWAINQSMITEYAFAWDFDKKASIIR